MSFPGTRQQIYDALFALGAVAQWGSPPSGFLYSSQRFQHWEKISDQPSLLQIAHEEYHEQVTGMPYKRRLTAKWVVYYRTAADPTVAGSDLGNVILDALTAALKPVPAPGVPFNGNLTLGGLVYHTFIKGQVFRDGGDLDGQGILVVPIEILVP